MKKTSCTGDDMIRRVWKESVTANGMVLYGGDGYGCT